MPFMGTAHNHHELPVLSNRKQDVSSIWKKAWLFQYLAAIKWFHDHDMPYYRFLVPSLLLEGFILYILYTT